MRKKLLFIVLCAVLLPAYLFSAGQQEGATGEAESAQPVTLDWWVGSWITQEHKDERQANDFEIYFEQKYPHIDINVVPIAWEGMHDKFSLAAKTNNLPHIMTSEDFLGWTAEFAASGNVMDLTDFVKNEIGVDKWRTDQVLANASYNGKIYAFPYRNSTRALVWNIDMFADAGLDPDTPPETWAELLDYGKKLTTGEKFGFSYPVKRDTTVAPEYLRSIMDAYGADITNDALTKATINTPEAKEAIRFWTDMVTKHGIVPRDVINNDDNDDFIMFGSGITGMCLVGPWTVETFRVQSPDLNYGATTVPSNKKGTPGRFGLVSMGWVIRKNLTDAEKEAVFTFLREQIKPEVNIWFTDSLPAAADVPKEGKNPVSGRTVNFEDHPKYPAFLEQLNHVYPSALLHPAGPQIAVETNVAIQKIILGEDLDKVLDEANKNIDKLLQSE